MALVLKDEERPKVEALRARVEGELAGSMSAEQREFLNDITYTRFLRARGMNVDKAHSMLSASLAWREKESPASLVCQACVRRNRRSHTMRCIGRDFQGRPVFYSHFTGVENRDPDENAQHLVWMLENCFTNDPSLPQQYVWVVDFVGFGRQDLSPAIGKKSLQIFSDQYPERLGKVVILDSPLVFSGLWRILSAFIDSHTNSKVHFVSLSSRKPVFEELFDAELIELLESEISDARNPEVLRDKNWWASAKEPCPSRKHAELLQS